jgi:putative Ca2+/H+ antiporter (TMEM165/GDT1 family)
MDLRVFLPVFSTILIDERGDQTQIANPPIQQDR